MYLSYVTQYPLEDISVDIITPFCTWVYFCMALFLPHLLLNQLVGKINETCQRSNSFDDSKSHLVKNNQDFELSKQLPCSSDHQKKEEDGNPCRQDAEIVMERLGIFCHPEGEKIQERFGSGDISNLFEEEEPSLEEVKGAFDVFDEKRDGFIDAEELQRVLRLLGFKEGLELENCKRMISVFDENGDGRIDFGEFAKLMENSLC